METPQRDRALIMTKSRGWKTGEGRQASRVTPMTPRTRRPRSDTSAPQGEADKDGATAGAESLG